MSGHSKVSTSTVKGKVKKYADGTVKPKQKTFLLANLEHKKASNFEHVYCYQVGIGSNVFDVSLVFGQLVPHTMGTEGLPFVEDRVAVPMSWEHLKSLTVALTRAVETYEKDYKTQIRNSPR